MLCDRKRQAILHWFNSLNVTEDLQSLEQLQDGTHFRSALKSVLEPRKEFRTYTNTKGVTFLKDGEAKENFTFLQNYIDDAFKLKSEELICYEDCLSGNELELAKIALFILTSIVQHLLNNKTVHLELLSHLDVSIQQEIMECLSLILQHPAKEIRKTEIHRILHRPAKYKEPSRRLKGSSPAQSASIQDSGFVTPQGRGRPRKMSSCNSSTPQGRGRPRKMSSCNSCTPQGTSGEDSPLMSLLESPKVRNWAVIRGKDQEISLLRKQLFDVENRFYDQRLVIEEIRKEIRKKDHEIMQLKEKYQTNQLEADEVLDRNRSLDEKLTLKDKDWNKTEEMFKKDMKILQEEIETWKIKCRDLDKELQSCRSHELPADVSSQLSEVHIELQEKEEKNELLLEQNKKLEESTKELGDMLSFYKDKLAEREKEKEQELTMLMERSTENLGNVIDEEYRETRKKLHLKEIEVSLLQKKIAEKMDLIKKMEMQGKCNCSGFSSRSENVAKVEEIQVPEKSSTCENHSEEQLVRLHSAQLWTRYDEKKMDAGIGIDNYHVDLDQVLQSVCEEKKDDETKQLVQSRLADIIRLTKTVIVTFGQSSHQTTESPLPDDVKDSCNESSDPIESVNYIKQLLEGILRERAVPSQIEGSEKTILCELEKSEDASLDSGVNICTAADPAVMSLLLDKDNLTQKNNELTSLCDDLKGQLEKKEAEKEALSEENKELHQLYEEVLKAKEEHVCKNDVLSEQLTLTSEKIKKFEKELKIAAEQKNVTHKKYDRVKIYTCNIENKLNEIKDKYQIKVNEGEMLKERLKRAENAEKEHALIANQEKESKRRVAARLAILQNDYDSLKRTLKALEDDYKKLMTKHTKLVSLRETTQAFKSGTEQDRADIIHKCFDKAISTPDEIIIGVHHKGGKQSAAQKILRVNAVFGDKGNESSLSGNVFNKSLHGTFVADDEEDFLNHSSLPRFFPVPDPLDDEQRLLELNRRNTLCQPHLRTAYAVEMQGYTSTQKRKLSSSGLDTPSASKRFFQTPQSLQRLMKRSEAKKKKLAGVVRPRMKI